MDKSPIVRSGFSADFWSAQKSTGKIPPIIVRLKSPLKKSILKICRRTSGGLRQSGHSSANVVCRVRVRVRARVRARVRLTKCGVNLILTLPLTLTFDPNQNP